jgi:pimeloyl-ACP methyl ester carboxylesterase
MRAREPDSEGYVDRDGVKLHREVLGAGEPTLLLLPAWTIVHARFWKAQVPYLARATGGNLVVIEGAGHLPNARDPVRVNRLVREFAASLAAGGGG